MKDTKKKQPRLFEHYNKVGCKENQNSFDTST